MEHAPLRPVPSRAAGPIDPVAAARELAAALPYLSEVEARALALVAMAAMPRADAVEALGVDERTLSDALATGRKELRRTVATLPGSGWCERAERLISHRLHRPRAGKRTPASPPPPQPAPGEQPPVEVPPAEDAPAGQASAETPPTEVPPVEEPPVEEPPVEEPVEEPPVEEPPVEEPPAAAAALPRAPADVAAAAEVLVAVRTRRPVAAAITWNALVVLAVLLALVTIGFTVAGILGAEL